MDGMTRIMQRIQDIEKRFGLMRHNQESVPNAGDPQKVQNFDDSVKQAMKSDKMQPVQTDQTAIRQGVNAAEGVMNTLSNGMNNEMLPGNMLNGNQSGLSGLMKLLPNITRHLQGENVDKGSGKNSTIPGREAASRYNSNYIPVE